MVEFSPPLARVHDAWVLNGFTGREILAMSPHQFVEAIKSMHEIAPGCARLASHQVSRVHEALLQALKKYADNGHEDSLGPHVADHERYVRSSGLGGGALAMGNAANTPARSESTINISSSSSSDCKLLSSNAAPLAFKRVVEDDAIGVPKRSLFSADPSEGDTSFMSQLGDKPRGTTLKSSALKWGAVFIEGQDGRIILQSAPPVVANYKQFTSWDKKAWMEFIAQYRDETDRLPVSAQRPATELVKHTVIEQILDDYAHVVDSWKEMTDAKLIAICFEAFGPKCARDAQLMLQASGFYFNDATMHQSTFTSKLVSFFSQKLTMIADFEHSAKKWPLTPLGEKLTKYLMFEALRACFPTDGKVLGPDGKTLVPKSSNNKTIQSLIRENQHDKTFKELTTIIKKHFRAIDARATQGQGLKYDVEPWKKTEPQERHDDDADAPESRRNGNVVGGGNRGGGANPGGGGNRLPNKNNYRKNVNEIKTGGIAKKGKPGDKGARCCNCGKRGHKATKDECRFWGHSKAKGASGVWDADEASLRLSNEEFTAWCTGGGKAFLEKEKANKEASKNANKSAQCSSTAAPPCNECHGECSPVKEPEKRTDEIRLNPVETYDKTPNPNKGRRANENDIQRAVSNAEQASVRRSEKSPGKAPVRRADGIPNPPDIQPGQCRVAYIFEMGATGMTTAFHATGRFARNIASRAPRSAKVLMDPGADVNLIRTSVVTGVTKSSTLKVLSTRHSPTDLFNNGIKIGHVKNEHELEFKLDTPTGIASLT